MRSAIALAFMMVFLGVGASGAAQPAPDPTLAPKPAPAPASLSEPQRQALALVHAEGDMLIAYRALLPQVSPETQAVLGESQRLWNRYAETRCLAGPPEPARTPRAPRRETQTQCRVSLAFAREAELKTALQVVGPWTFVRWVDHRDHLASLEHGGGPVEETVFHLALAKPASDAERRWNQVVARQLQQTLAAAYGLAENDPRLASADALDLLNVRDVDVQARVDPLAVSPDLIEVSIHAVADPSGPSPAEASARNLIWSFKLGRAIDATDLFDPKASWRPSLAQMAADRIDPSAPPAARPTFQTVSTLVTDPTRWRLSPAGLAVDFRPVSGPAASPGAPTALVPWPLLAPYLRRPFFVDPANLTEGPKG